MADEETTTGQGAALDTTPPPAPGPDPAPEQTPEPTDTDTATTAPTTEPVAVDPAPAVPTDGAAVAGVNDTTPPQDAGGNAGDTAPAATSGGGDNIGATVEDRQLAASDSIAEGRALDRGDVTLQELAADRDPAAAGDDSQAPAGQDSPEIVPSPSEDAPAQTESAAPPEDERPETIDGVSTAEPEGDVAALGDRVLYRDPAYPNREVLRVADVIEVDEEQGIVRAVVYYPSYMNYEGGLRPGNAPGQYRPI